MAASLCLVKYLKEEKEEKKRSFIFVAHSIIIQKAKRS